MVYKLLLQMAKNVCVNGLIFVTCFWNELMLNYALAVENFQHYLAFWVICMKHLLPAWLPVWDLTSGLYIMKVVLCLCRTHSY